MDRNLLTMKRLYANSLRYHGGKTALHFEDVSMTYEELRRAANRVASGLVRHGVRPNTRVALLMSNRIEYPVCEMGVYQAGAVRVSLNDMLGEKEIRHILSDSGAKVLFVGENFYETMLKIRGDLPELQTIVGLGPDESCPDGFVSWGAFQGSEPEEDVEVDVKADDMGAFYYTGGTTGVPKAVVQSQENMVMIVHTQIMLLNLLQEDRLLLMTPLPHAAGLTYLGSLVLGAEHFIERRFDPERAVQLIQKHKITYMYMVPTIIYRLLDYIKDNKYDFSSIRTIQYGAAPISAERLKECLEVFGPVFQQLYGLSEVMTFVSKLSKEDHTLDPRHIHRLKSAGKPVFMTEVKIVDEQGDEVERGQAGEIAARSLGSMIAYHQNPQLTRETMKDGWVYTGDMGMMDEDGYVYLLDRKKDMIISGGMNVYSTEVEDAIQKHPAVSQVAVIGIPHPDWGEQVAAFIVPKQGVPLSLESIKHLCDQELSKYKRPKQLTIVESLPLTAYGKVDKKTLRQPYWEKAGRNIN